MYTTAAIISGEPFYRPTGQHWIGMGTGIVDIGAFPFSLLDSKVSIMGSMRPDIGRVPVDSSAIGNADPAPSMSWILNLSLADRAFLCLSDSCRYATEASGDSVP